MAQKTNFFVVLFAALLSGGCAEQLQFRFQLSQMPTQCFIEFMGEGTEAVVELVGSHKEMMMTLSDPKGRQLSQQRHKEDQDKIRYHWAAYNAGNHQVCVQNLARNNPLDVDFTIQTGVQATDYSNIVQRKHLKPIEANALRVEDMIKKARMELAAAVIFEEELKYKQQQLQSNVVWFGALTIIVMAVATYAQVSYLKNFFRYKKII